MPDYTYPTLASVRNVYEEFEEDLASDPTVRVVSEGKYTKTYCSTARAVLPRSFKFAHNGLTEADKEILRTFQNTVRAGGASFNWTYPDTSASVLRVRFKTTVKFTPLTGTAAPGTRWKAVIELEEV